MLEAVLRNHAPWAGAQLRFVRKEMDLTQSEFAKIVHAKSYTNVVSWEGKEQQHTGLSEQAELYMRLRIVSELNGNDLVLEFFQLYQSQKITPVALHRRLAHLCASLHTSFDSAPRALPDFIF